VHRLDGLQLAAQLTAGHAAQHTAHHAADHAALDAALDASGDVLVLLGLVQVVAQVLDILELDLFRFVRVGLDLFGVVVLFLFLDHRRRRGRRGRRRGRGGLFFGHGLFEEADLDGAVIAHDFFGHLHAGVEEGAQEAAVEGQREQDGTRFALLAHASSASYSFEHMG